MIVSESFEGSEERRVLIGMVTDPVVLGRIAGKWDAEGVQIAGSCVGTLNDDSDTDQYWIVELAIPLKNFSKVAKEIPPRPGTVMNLNLNRHGGKTNFQYSQWSRADTDVPAFHTPHRFGKVIFSAKSSPFEAGESAR